MTDETYSTSARENYAAMLEETLRKAQDNLNEAKRGVAILVAEQKMENLYQQGRILFRQYGSRKDIPVQFRRKRANLRIEDLQIGTSFSDRDNLRFIVSDTDPHETFLADISLTRMPDGDWMAHETADVQNDSWLGGHGSRKEARASGVIDSNGGMHNGCGLSDGLMGVIATVEILTRSASLEAVKV